LSSFFWYAWFLSPLFLLIYFDCCLVRDSWFFCSEDFLFFFVCFDTLFCMFECDLTRRISIELLFLFRSTVQNSFIRSKRKNGIQGIVFFIE
jgi:hypothetical protein